MSVATSVVIVVLAAYLVASVGLVAQSIGPIAAAFVIAFAVIVSLRAAHNIIWGTTDE